MQNATSNQGYVQLVAQQMHMIIGFVFDRLFGGHTHDATAVAAEEVMLLLLFTAAAASFEKHTCDVNFFNKHVR